MRVYFSPWDARWRSWAVPEFHDGRHVHETYCVRGNSGVDSVIGSTCCKPIQRQLERRLLHSDDHSENGWSKSFSITCYGTKFTVGVSGQALDTELITGMVTFTGTGTFSGSVTQSGEFDQTASANTTTVTCSGSAKSPGYITNTGYAVYDAPSTSSASGTYTVASAGTGTMMVQTGQGEAPLVLSLGDFNSANVASVVLLTKTAGDEWEPSVGTAVLK